MPRPSPTLSATIARRVFDRPATDPPSTDDGADAASRSLVWDASGS
jgi:hypothetical protein